MQQEQIFISNPYSNVLVLAGRELIFFTGAVLWIYAENSADNTGMFSLLLSSACTEPRPFSAPHPTPPTKRMRVHSQEGTQLGQPIPADPRDIAAHMVSCSAYKVEEAVLFVILTHH